MSTLIVIALVLLVACLTGAHRRPLIVLMLIAAIGAANHNGMLPTPRFIAVPLASAQASIHGWQQRASARLSCAVQAENQTETSPIPAGC
jgi:hypothetical protein